MKVVGLQVDIVWEDVAQNLGRLDDHVAAAARDGADLAVLPEMFATGFSMQAEVVAAHAERIRSALRDAARKHGVAILAGYAEPFDPRPRNAGVLFDARGEERLLYHKIHPFSLAREDDHYVGGHRLPTTDVAGVRITPLICYDLRFPEPFRLAADRTDLFCVIANWPASRSSHWRALLMARALENQAWVLGVNRVGEGDGLTYAGDTTLIDPWGRIVATAAEQEARVGGVVEAEAVTAARRKLTALADRRSVVYRRLADQREDK